METPKRFHHGKVVVYGNDLIIEKFIVLWSLLLIEFKICLMKYIKNATLEICFCHKSGKKLRAEY